MPTAEHLTSERSSEKQAEIRIRGLFDTVSSDKVALVGRPNKVGRANVSVAKRKWHSLAVFARTPAWCRVSETTRKWSSFIPRGAPTPEKIWRSKRISASSISWLRRQIFTDFLRHSIEDNPVDTSGKEFQLALAALEELRAAPARAFGLGGKPARALDALIHSIQAPRPDPEYQELIIKPGLRIKGRVPSKGQQSLPVSCMSAKFVPVLDENLADPSIAPALVTEYEKRIERLCGKHKITALCFIQKDIGPVGALAMLSTLVAMTGLPACIYRLTHWSERAAITGYRPSESDKLLVVYDLVVTGSGITQPAVDLLRLTGARVAAAVVAFGYDKKRTVLTFSEEQEIELDTIGWYSDHIDQIEKFEQQKDYRESSSVTGEALKASPVLGALASFPVSQEDNMAPTEKIRVPSAEGQTTPEMRYTPSFLAEGFSMDELLKAMDEQLRTPDDVHALLERRKADYDAGWAVYKGSLPK